MVAPPHCEPIDASEQNGTDTRLDCVHDAGTDGEIRKGTEVEGWEVLFRISPLQELDARLKGIRAFIAQTQSNRLHVWAQRGDRGSRPVFLLRPRASGLLASIWCGLFRSLHGGVGSASDLVRRRVCGDLVSTRLAERARPLPPSHDRIRKAVSRKAKSQFRAGTVHKWTDERVLLTHDGAG
jgi:hypothetical protein